MEKIVREPIVEGIFYPDTAAELTLEVKRLLDQSGMQPDSSRAIITPHAGFRYSGKTVAAGFRAAERSNPDSIVILAPVHREFEQFLYLPESDAFSNCLGSVEINKTMLMELAAVDKKIVFNDIPHLEEHCIEVLIPFIQVLFPGKKIVPILMGLQNKKMADLCARALTAVFAGRTSKPLFICSANLTGYLRAEEAALNAERLLESLTSGNTEAIYRDTQSSKITSCGPAALAGIVEFLKNQHSPAVKAKLLRRDNSLAVNGDLANVVEYASLSFPDFT